MKIMIIDDDEVNLFLTQRMLVLCEITNNIQTFQFPKKALQYIQVVKDEDLPDVILLDLDMPILNGWEFLEELTPHWKKDRKKYRIYILTSSLDSLDEEKAKSHPMITGLLHKPLTKENINFISLPD